MHALSLGKPLQALWVGAQAKRVEAKVAWQPAEMGMGRGVL